MTPIAHGGNVHAVARERRWPLQRLVDFSASINPLGPSPRAIRAITRALPQIVHYPDPDCVVLRVALSQRHGLPTDTVAVGNGSTELIHLLPQIIDLRRVLIIGPTFSEYARAIQQQGGTVVPLNADRQSAYRPPIQDAISTVRKESSELTAVVLCNPNSPTGRMVVAKEVRALAAAASRTGAWVIVDETFAEYCEECSVLSDATEESKLRAKLVVLRSFTKFYAIPGLRVGYLVASRAVAARMRARLPTWSVNNLAQAAAVAALFDERHTQRSLRFMTQERPRLTARLREFPGVTVYPSDANFLLLEVPRSAAGVVQALKRHGVLLRDCSGIPGLSARTVRVAVRRRDENDRLLKLLQSAL
jgi:threonine-phosphate decarboxylase